MLQANYENIKKVGLSIVLFSFEDNSIFLRVHKPNNFGDDISKERYGITYVNSEKKYINGFEEGKVSHGFHNIFPLFYNNEYIGSVDIAFPSEYMQKNMRNLNGINTYFIIDTNNKVSTLIKKELEYNQITQNDNLFSNMLHLALHNFFIPKTQIISENIKENFQKNNDKFSLCHNNNYATYIINFLPIKSIKDEKAVAYLVSFEESDYLDDILHEHIIFVFITIFILLLLSIAICFIIKKHLFLILEVDKKTKDLKIQKNKLEDININLEEQVNARVRDIIVLDKEIQDTQKEVVFTMGSIAESRSKETGKHVKRVAEYSKLLAIYYGLPEDEAEMLKQASPMHDIGKVAIPDAILNKPGSFNKDEKVIMQTHAKLGYEMLKHSERPLLQMAATVANEHHEKWDGTGYPNRTHGENIHIYGRITALADVFDALGSDRVYKKAWELQRILDFFQQERAKHFDPKLIDIFFENLDDFLEIRNKFID